jgi:hypothetical protein
MLRKIDESFGKFKCTLAKLKNELLVFPPTPMAYLLLGFSLVLGERREKGVSFAFL